MGIPVADSVLLRNAAIPGALLAGDDATPGLRARDLLIEGGRIATILPCGAPPPEGAAIHDLRGGLVLPVFADIHTHLDKGHIWPRRANPDGTWPSALSSVIADRHANWSASDVRQRMDFALRAAYAHGTAAIRTHIDSEPPQHDISWDVFEATREAWAGRVELQAVALVGPHILLDRLALAVIARRAKAGHGLMGGAVRVDSDSKRAMLNVVEIAGELGLDLDLHVDETADPAASALLHLAEAVLETGYRGRVLAGHCCSLAVQDEPTRRQTIERVAEAGVAVVSLPMCNLYLQDRDPAGRATPAWRGVTALKELNAAGVPVAIASDNTRDPFYAYGDLDALEVFREGARIVHFDHPQDDAWSWLRTVTSGAAAIAGFTQGCQIAEGAPADLVLFSARNWTELLARPQSDRIVLRGGAAIDTTLPDYRELDELMT